MFVTWNREPGSMQIEHASSVAVRYCPKQPHTALLGSFLHICPSLLFMFVHASGGKSKVHANAYAPLDSKISTKELKLDSGFGVFWCP